MIAIIIQRWKMFWCDHREIKKVLTFREFHEGVEMHECRNCGKQFVKEAQTYNDNLKRWKTKTHILIEVDPKEKP